MVDRGVGWHTGRVLFGEREVFHFDLLPEAGHERPAFINLQQYFAEAALVERALALPLIELRWKNEVVAVESRDDGALVTVQTPDGRYPLHADWLVACDGARSPVRAALGLEAKGRVFRDRFLIADVTMDADFPAERRFWFDPPFHPGQSVLLHRQSEGVWRIDFQLGWDADPEVEKQPERILPRVKALLAASGVAEPGVQLVWASVYTFACERMERFVHGRVLFAGDAAHRVSPFGARGANSGVQDADNLGWKLAAVLRGEAGTALIDSYGVEREAAADENLRASHPQHRLHHAQERDLAPVPRRGAGPGARARLCARAGQQRAAVAADDLHRVAAEQRRRGRLRRRRRGRRAGARRTDRRRLAAAPAGARLHVAGLWQRAGRGRPRAPHAGRDTSSSPGNATTRAPAPPTCCAPTATSPHAGARRPPTWCAPRCAARWRRSEAMTTAKLLTDNRLASPDAFYEALLQAHQGLSTEQSHALNARLVLLLANHIGDAEVLGEALAAARINTSRPGFDAMNYQSGFGNQFATEAVPGALPVGRNSPQRAPHGLYAELISGSAFTAPRAENQRTWVYRRRPSVVVGGYAPLAQPWLKTGATDGVDVAARSAALASDRRCRRRAGRLRRRAAHHRASTATPRRSAASRRTWRCSTARWAAGLRQRRRRAAAGAAAGRADASPPSSACWTSGRARSRCCRAASLFR